MSWDEKPYYEKNATTKGNIDIENKNVVSIRSKIPWASEVIKRSHKSTSPSPILSWYIQEDAKRSKGLDSEIDQADKKAAMLGVKNKFWSKN